MIKWDISENPLYLFTPAELEQIPSGTVLECIDGSFVTKGVDEIDTDTRFGHTAFGARSIETHPESALFLTFVLKS